MSSIEFKRKKRNYYDFYKDYVGKKFRHLLDYYEDGTEKVNGVVKDLYIGTYVTTTDNEDFTYLGYDFYIKWSESPLLNGSIEQFIETFGKLGNSEIGSRGEIIKRFKEQLVKLVRTTEPVSAKEPVFLNHTGVKAYYLKKVDGLTNLNDQSDSSKSKAFVEYGTEFITLGFNEDVTQNLGYLAALYKSLSWSRLRGKQVIPENLLRFDVDIVVTEARKMTRVVIDTENNKKTEYADQITNYVYTIYECQFFFTDMPHGSALDMSALTTVEDYSVKFNYKFSTLRFNKLDFQQGDYTKKIEFAIDNAQSNLAFNDPRKTKNSSAENGTIATGQNLYQLEVVSEFDITTGKSKNMGLSGSLQQANEAKPPVGFQGPGDEKPDDQITNQQNQLSEKKPNFRERLTNYRDSLGGDNKNKNRKSFTLSALEKNLNNALTNNNRGGKKKDFKEQAFGFLTNFASSQITKQASLLNRTLRNIKIK
jgi:hypothetical protein